MSPRPVFFLFIALLVTAVIFSGCTSQQAAPQTPAVVATTLTLTPAPEGTAPEKTAEVTKPVTSAASEKVMLTTKGMISPTGFETFDFKSMGDQFSQPGEQYRITIKADKPVIGYAVTNFQASQLTGDTLTPHYVPHSEKIQWGLTEPYMVMEKVTDSTRIFTVDEIAPFVYVVDARWMTFDENYKSVGPFNYELTITKIIT